MPDEVQKWCDLGQQHLDQGEPEKALDCYARAIDADPENADAWCGRAKSYYDLGRLERADRDYRRALRLGKAALAELGRHRPHRWWIDTATRPYMHALRGRGLCRYWMGDWPSAVRLFRKLLRLSPTDPLDVGYLLGESYQREGDVDQAVRAWQQQGDDPDALYNIGLAYFFRGEFTRSVGAFRRAIFENLFLVARLTNGEIVSGVPRYAGTHVKGLDCEGAAADYLERCGDLWRGRPLLARWLRAIYEHPRVQADIRAHVEQLRTLTRDDLTPGDRARLEGENTSLRSEERLGRSDRLIAREVTDTLFRITG